MILRWMKPESFRIVLRGVLSEDGIYNLLERNKEMIELIKEFQREDSSSDK